MRRVAASALMIGGRPTPFLGSRAINARHSFIFVWYSVLFGVVVLYIDSAATIIDSACSTCLFKASSSWIRNVMTTSLALSNSFSIPLTVSVCQAACHPPSSTEGKNNGLACAKRAWSNLICNAFTCASAALISWRNLAIVAALLETCEPFIVTFKWP